MVKWTKNKLNKRKNGIEVFLKQYFLYMKIKIIKFQDLWIITIIMTINMDKIANIRIKIIHRIKINSLQIHIAQLSLLKKNKILIILIPSHNKRNPFQQLRKKIIINHLYNILQRGQLILYKIQPKKM